MMLNRWGLNVRRGLPVRVSLARGGKECGIVRGFERISGYGWRVILESGKSAGIDDAEADYSEQIEIMARHFLIAALWADCDEGTHPRVSRQAQDAARRICAAFVDRIGPGMFAEALAAPGYGSHPDCGNVWPQCAAMGHDLYLTSLGHGAGFWDRSDLNSDGLGDRLTEACKPCRFDPEFYRGWLYLHIYDRGQ